MDELEYLEVLGNEWPGPSEDHASSRALALSAQAVREHPRSIRLLIVRGNLLLLAPPGYESSDSPVGCYRRAVIIDDTAAEAWEDLGYYYDSYEDEFDLAIEAFEQALRCGGGVDSIYGLARSLAQANRIGEALARLDGAIAGQLSDEDKRKLIELRQEIEEREWTYDDPRNDQ